MPRYKTRGTSKICLESDFIILLWIGAPWGGGAVLFCSLGLDCSDARWNDLGLYCRITRTTFIETGNWRAWKSRSNAGNMKGLEGDIRREQTWAHRRPISEVWGHDPRGMGQACEAGCGPYLSNSMLCMFSHSVMSDSLWPYGLESARLLCSRNSPGKTTGMGYHFLLQGIFPTQGSNLNLLYCRQVLYPELPGKPQ